MNSHLAYVVAGAINAPSLRPSAKRPTGLSELPSANDRVTALCPVSPCTLGIHKKSHTLGVLVIDGHTSVQTAKPEWGYAFELFEDALKIFDIFKPTLARNFADVAIGVE
ncbi:hypothetical protein IAD21_01679 [Abditibacteriota bacterium]|nr:hypothetical protein IAD21_01679 [Abditibacteriota bacterium]